MSTRLMCVYSCSIHTCSMVSTIIVQTNGSLLNDDKHIYKFIQYISIWKKATYYFLEIELPYIEDDKT